MADTRTVSVRLKADVTSYTTSMKKASQSTADFDKQQARSQASAEKWRAVGLASKIGGAALAAGLLAATKAASNQEQAMGALTSVFKANGAQMTANAKGAAQMGLSTTDYANAAAKLGSQLSNLGVDQADLGVTTDDLIKKAGDLAAQFGGTTQEAVDALGAAMRGEADPAERYGLALNVTAVNAEMAATGADKAQAMMSLLNKQMGKSGAVGAMGREFDTAAAATQRAQAEFENASASLGEALLPAMATAAKVASGLLEKFNGLSDSTKQTTTYVVAFGAMALLAGPKIVTLANGLVDLKAKFKETGDEALASKTKIAGPAGLIVAFGAAKTAIATMNDQVSESTGISQRWLDALTNVLGSGIDPMRLPVSLLTEAFRQLGISMDILPDTLTGDSDVNQELQTYIDRVNAGEGSAQAFSDAINAGKAPADAFADAVAAGGTAVDKSADASMADAEAKENEAAALKKATEAYDAYIGAVNEALGLLSAQNNMAGQVERLTDAVKENGTALDKHSKAGRANRDVMIGELGSITDLVDATHKNVAAKKGEEAGLRAANRVRREELARLKESAAALGFNKQKIDAMVRASGLAKPIRMPVSAPGLDETTRQVEALARAAKKVVNNSGLGGFGFGQNRAAGGYITGPGTGTSDDIPANLSNGEYVLRASAVKRIGVGELDRMNYANGGVVGYAKGGKAKKKPGKGKGMGQGGGGLGNVQKWTDAVKDARDNLRDIKDEAADYAKSIKDNILSGTGLFDMFSKSKAESATAGLASAQEQLAEASRKVAAAQIAVNTASPENRASAIAALADAQRDLADAQTNQAKAQGEADAAAPTPANIMGRMKARADAIVAYASKVKTLMGKGLSMGLIKELAGADMVEAGPVLDALLSMSPEALKELSSVDKRAKDAAASIGDAVSTGGGVPGGGAFGGKIGDAKAELGVSTDGLDKAIRLADKKFLDKSWRKVLAKAGLSAEERVQLMQSLKQNDGKLTKHWRNVLAKAGLSAEERAELTVALTGADTTMSREWRNKLQKTGLSAEERQELADELAGAKNPGRALRRYWIDELQETGLSAKESASLADEIANTKHPSKALYRDWMGQLQATGLTAREAADMIGNIQSSNRTVNDNFTNGKTATLGAGKSGDFDGNVSGATGDIRRDFQGKDAVLDNKKSDTFKTTNDGATTDIKNQFLGKDAVLDNKKSDNFKETNEGATTDIKNQFQGKDAVLSAKENKTGINLAIAAAKKIISDGFKGFKLNIGAKGPAGSSTRRRRFSATAEDEESTLDATIGVGSDASMDSEPLGAARHLKGAWGDRRFTATLTAERSGIKDAADGADAVAKAEWGGNRYNAKLGVKLAGDFLADIQGIKDAIAWSLNVPAVKMHVDLKTGGGGNNKATGGLITGPGTGTSDSILAALSNGEYVVRASSVAKYGTDMLSAINTGRYANGGPVGFRTTTSAPNGGANGVTTTSVPVIVQLDGRTIAQSQLKLQRQSGGTFTVGG